MRQNPVSFWSARDLRARLESLPSGPRWKYQTMALPGFQTKEPIVLYYREGIEAVERLYSNPIFTSCMDISLYHLYTHPNKLPHQRVFGEFMSADFAWNYQLRLL